MTSTTASTSEISEQCVKRRASNACGSNMVPLPTFSHQYAVAVLAVGCIGILFQLLSQDELDERTGRGVGRPAQLLKGRESPMGASLASRASHDERSMLARAKLGASESGVSF